MSATIAPAPIRKSFDLRASPQTAFRVFTEGFDRWWPRTHTVGKAPLARAVLESGQGGRWYGVDENGEEDTWGDVLAWEPPVRLLLAWRINARFECDPSVLSEVEVRFTDLGDGRCRVDFEHRGLERLGEGAKASAANMDRGWGEILALYQAAAQS